VPKANLETRFNPSAERDNFNKLNLIIMKLESLKNEKFESNQISEASMRMLKGGGQYATNIQPRGDTGYYECTGGKYDRTLTYYDDEGGISMVFEKSDKIFEESKPDWYS